MKTKRSSLVMLCSVLFLSLGFTACTLEKDDMASDNYQKLQGYWEVVNVEEKEKTIVTNLGSGDVKVYENDSPAEAVAPGSVDYYVLHFGKKASMVSTGDPDMAEFLDLSFGYSLSENKLSCPFFYGDYTTFVTIEKLTEDTMILRQDDNGSYIDKEVNIREESVFMCRTIFKRVQ